MATLSVVIPMFNESSRFQTGVAQVLTYLADRHPGTEVILVDDGSTDGTPLLAGSLLQEFPSLSGQVLTIPHAGKGAAVQAGMLKATGDVRMFLDSDNATPIEELERLLPMVKTDRTIIIGSRALNPTLLEERQPLWREFLGKTFNRFLRLIVRLPYKDTQCGFKLFGKTAAEKCFSQQTLPGFAFDVEILWIARKEKLEVWEIPVRWRHVADSRVRPLRHGIQMGMDSLRIRFRH